MNIFCPIEMNKAFTPVHLTDPKSQHGFMVFIDSNRIERVVTSGTLKLNQREIKLLNQKYMGDKRKLLVIKESQEDPVLTTINSLIHGAKCIIFAVPKEQRVDCSRIEDTYPDKDILHFNIIPYDMKKPLMTYKKFVKFCRSTVPLPRDLITSNDQLETIAEALGIKNFNVYVSPDCNGDKIKEGQICIINASTFGGVGHWTTAAWCNGNKIFYDSFGCVPTEGTRLFMNGKFQLAGSETQAIEDSSCGIKTLYICYGINGDYDLNDILYEMDI